MFCRIAMLLGLPVEAITGLAEADCCACAWARERHPANINRLARKAMKKIDFDLMFMSMVAHERACIRIPVGYCLKIPILLSSRA